MTRIWRQDVRVLLAAFMVLDVAIWVYTETAGSAINAHIDLTAQQATWTAIGAFLCWRVWRGGRMAWAARNSASS
jgi:hypothetical protein